MELVFTGEVIEWRGPAPFLFVRIPDEQGDVLVDHAAQLSYGWGCIAAEVTIGTTQFTTSLMPRDGGYLVPVKVAVQRAEQVGFGDVVSVIVEVTDPFTR